MDFIVELLRDEAEYLLSADRASLAVGFVTDSLITLMRGAAWAAERLRMTVAMARNANLVFISQLTFAETLGSSCVHS